MAFTYSIDERGALNSGDYRVYYRKFFFIIIVCVFRVYLSLTVYTFKGDGNGNPISPWHDIPLFANKAERIYNMVVEIPRWTNAKMEIATGEPLNPIKQDVKKGALRFVKNPFPHKGYIWNYGAFPQTWEDPNHVDEGTKAKGDNDPIDVLEIGSYIAKRGEILQVKVLGTVALIDEGETDWKIITINVNDPDAKNLNDIGDVEKLMPGLLQATVEWFKIYKIPDGKPANEFAFNGEAKNREFAEKVVEETANYWQQLVSKPNNPTKLSLENTSQSNSFSISDSNATAVVEAKQPTSSLKPEPIPDQASLDKCYYIKL